MSSGIPDLCSIPGIDPRLEELVGVLGLEGGSRAYLEEVRWPDGVVCPRCSAARTGYLEAREKHYCRDCSYQFRVSAGTVLHDSHAALSYWLVALGLILRSGHGYPATQLHQALGGSYKTAWFVGHRIRAALSQSLIESGMPVALARGAVEEAGDEVSPAPDIADLGGPAGQGWKLVRTLVAGAYHRPSIEHLTAYWNESRWRAANIGNEHAFRETVRALLDTEPLQPTSRLDRSPAQVATVKTSRARSGFRLKTRTGASTSCGSCRGSVAQRSQRHPQHRYRLRTAG